MTSHIRGGSREGRLGAAAPPLLLRRCRPRAEGAGAAPSQCSFCHLCRRVDAHPRGASQYIARVGAHRMGRHIATLVGAHPSGAAHSDARVSTHPRGRHLLSPVWAPTRAGLHILSPVWAPIRAGRHILSLVWAPIHAGRHLLPPVWAPIRAGGNGSRHPCGRPSARGAPSIACVGTLPRGAAPSVPRVGAHPCRRHILSSVSARPCGGSLYNLCGHPPARCGTFCRPFRWPSARGGTFCHPCWRPCMRGGTFRRMRERPFNVDAHPREGSFYCLCGYPTAWGGTFCPPCELPFVRGGTFCCQLWRPSERWFCVSPVWVSFRMERRILSPVWVPTRTGRHILSPVWAPIYAGLLSPVWVPSRAGRHILSPRVGSRPRYFGFTLYLGRNS